MNPTPQIDFHPDAESLNAFAEQALGASERAQMVAHLAGCGRCRQVVFLARQAADAEAALTLATAPPARRRPWFADWHMIWAPAAALAAAVALVIVFYPRPPAPHEELAKLAPQGEANGGKLALPAQAVPALGQKLEFPAAPNQPAGKAKSAPLPTFSAESADAASPAAAPQPASGGIAAPIMVTNAVIQPPDASAKGLTQQQAGAQSKPEPVVSPWQQDRQQAAAKVAPSPGPSLPAQQTMRPVADSNRASYTVPATAAMESNTLQVSPATTRAAAARPSMAMATAPLAAATLKLPSGLPVVSSALAPHTSLAIDLAGALFLSRDAGKRWEPVERRWTGRAIEVHVPRNLGGAAPVFELITDDGSTWTSADGVTWTPK